MQSTEGHGATFTFTLPLGVVAASPPSAPAVRAERESEEVEERPQSPEAHPEAERPRLRIIRRFESQ